MAVNSYDEQPLPGVAGIIMIFVIVGLFWFLVGMVAGWSIAHIR